MRSNIHMHCRALRFASAPSRYRLLSTRVQATEYVPLPRNVQEMIDTAVASAKRANREGANRHIIEFILPINEKRISFVSTEATDYPESNFSEFNCVCQLAKNFTLGIIGNDEAELKIKRIDEGGIDGDLCAIVSAPELAVVCVVWPTAGKLKQLKSLGEDKRIGQLIVVNPQWKTQGQLVSEFGIGPWRKANEEFLATFEPSYSLFEQRIGAPSSVNLARGSRYESGGVLRTQRCFPGPYEVHAMAPNGVSQAIGQFELSGGRPTYQQLDALIIQARQAKLDIFDVARAASSLAIERGEKVADQESSPESDLAAPEFYSRDQILDMDLAKLRRVLIGLGLPSAGTLSKLQSRALAVSDAVASGLSVEAGLKSAKALR